MGKDYQDRDKEFFDYKLSTPHGFDLPLRNGGMANFYGHATYIGAAQTFGRFVKYPYTELLENAVGYHSANLGIAGAGPAKFLGNEFVTNTVNSGAFCVLQIMSGRSVSNRFFHYLEGKWKGTSGMWNSKLKKNQLAEDAWEWALNNLPKEELIQLIDETKNNYVNEYISLVHSFKVPVILLWFSTRAKQHTPRFDKGVNAMLGSYPHIVDEEMVGKIAQHCEAYCEVVTNAGLPQTLFNMCTLEKMNRVKGDPRSTSTMNEYYPSPEMHMLCAYELAKTIKGLEL
jgi:hypothetical protein